MSGTSSVRSEISFLRPESAARSVAFSSAESLPSFLRHMLLVDSMPVLKRVKGGHDPMTQTRHEKNGNAFVSEHSLTR